MRGKDKPNAILKRMLNKKIANDISYYNIFKSALATEEKMIEEKLKHLEREEKKEKEKK